MWKQNVRIYRNCPKKGTFTRYRPNEIQPPPTPGLSQLWGSAMPKNAHTWMIPYF